MPRLVLPGMFGSGLVLMAAAAILWVRAGRSDEPVLAGVPPAVEATVVAQPTTEAAPTTKPASTTEPTQAGPRARSTSARAPYEEGKALFVAKGCVSCHWHKQAGVPSSQSYKVGPDLSNIESVPYGGMPNDADFLRKSLKDPESLRPGTQMPNLGLSDREIESLLKFLLIDERGLTSEG